jgi:hypothetical protein
MTPRPQSQYLGYKKQPLAVLLTQLLIISAAVPELRITPVGAVFTTFSYTQFAAGVGYPRLCEILALVICLTSVPRLVRMTRTSQQLRITLFLILLYLGSLGLILIYHDTGGWDRYRAGLLVPLSVYLAVASASFTHTAQKKILNAAVLSGAFASLTVILQPWLPNLFPALSNFDVLDTSRYMGSGQSPAYQGTFILLASAPLVGAIRQQNSISRIFPKLALLAFFGVGIAMTGTRMCVVVFIGLLIFALSKSLRAALLSGILGLTLLIISGIWSPDNAIILSLRGLVERAAHVEMGRSLPWIVALEILASYPMLGIGNFEVAVAKLGIDAPAHPQNLILGQALFGGIPMLILFSATLFKISAFVFKSINSRTNTDQSNRSILIAIVSVYILSGVTEIVDASVQVQLGFFILMGALTVLKGERIGSSGFGAQHRPRARLGGTASSQNPKNNKLAENKSFNA